MNPIPPSRRLNRPNRAITLADMIADARHDLRRAKKDHPERFPLWHELKQAEADLLAAKKKVARCRAAWKKFGGK